MQRLHIAIRGAVQGVGFRPFIYRLATEMKMPGWVLNSPQGVFIEVEGEKAALDGFLLRLDAEKPQHAFIQSMEFSFLDPLSYTTFEIRASLSDGNRNALVLPDIATCAECLREIFDPGNRRYLYPFTNCTHCGPRFSIIEAIPYDRSNTTMRIFEMCPECRSEYEDPLDRRFHAQPNACSACGPHLELWEPGGRILASRQEALAAAASQIRKGKVLALKGLGGFHLMADAGNPEAVTRLRKRKHREEKPFALMYPSVEAIRQDCEISPLEARLLASPEAPIVLLQRRGDASFITDDRMQCIAPGNPCLGILLPYTPLHHLLMKELGLPVIATSGNLSEEPICTDEHEALHRLRDVADVFLVHNRAIARHVDDSIVRVILDRELVFRRARGFAPLPLALPHGDSVSLAVGGHLKNTVALTVSGNAFLSQHIGDLENQEASDAFLKVIESLKFLYRAEPGRVVCDMHPDYLSTKYAHASGLPALHVQHHYAHVASCMAENRLEGTVLGVSWDGTGYGLDGTIWGGEFLRASLHDYERMATLRSFRLPGGTQAVREPRRSALGLLFEIFGEGLFERKDIIPLESFSSQEMAILRKMLSGRINAPVTTSAGRLFDGIASIIGLRQQTNFEGQAAMELEFAAGRPLTCKAYAYTTLDKTPIVFDWEPMIRAILEDLARSVSVRAIAARYHATLVEIIVTAARRAGQDRVVLTGGCFQNMYLLEGAVHRLKEAGFQPYWHQLVPPNDGGIALGQAAIAARI